MKSAVQVLTEARELLSDENKWTQGWLARDKDGEPVDERQVEAVCFCSVGAIYVTSDPFTPVPYSARKYLEAIVGNVPNWNDHTNRKHSEILEAFDKAIELAKEGEKV